MFELKKLIDKLRPRPAEEPPVRLLADPTEAHYLPFKWVTAHVDGLIEYAKTYRHAQASISILAVEGERYSYLKQDGETSPIQSVEKGMTLVGIHGFYDEKGEYLRCFGSDDGDKEQFLNNAGLFASDYAHGLTDKKK